MCGLVGIAGDLAFKDEATMKRLFLLDFFRGPDSTGLAAIRIGGDVKIAKISSHPIDLFEFPSFKSALAGSTSKAFIGHNRAATRGGVTSYNAHPFTFGGITGAHNGTLDYKSTKALEDALGTTYPVDSQALFAAIDAFGIKEAISMIEEGKDSATGAWSLVWHDASTDTLNFLRNKHRPLWYAYSKDFKRVFWASDWKMIANATQMQSTPDDLYVDPKGNSYWATDEDVHYKFDLTLLRQGKDKPKPKATKIKGKEPAPVVHRAAGNDPFMRQDGGTGSPTTKTISPSTGGSPRILIHLFGSGEQPFAGYMDRKRFDDIAGFGCSWCQDDILYETPGISVYERDDIILCPTCTAHNKTASDHATRIIVPPAVIDNYS